MYGSVEDIQQDVLEDEALVQPSIEDHSRHSLDDEVDATFAFDVPHFTLNGTPSENMDTILPKDLGRPRIDNIDVPKRSRKSKTAKSSPVKVSSHGISYSPINPMVVKRVASRFQRSFLKGRRATINGEVLEALMEASDRFFEQVGNDLRAYANHANRKKIDDSDVTTIMKR